MNWDAIGAIGQAVSALALVIVIVQVRHPRAEARRSVRHSRLDAARQLVTQLVESEQLGARYCQVKWACAGTGTVKLSALAQVLVLSS